MIHKAYVVVDVPEEHCPHRIKALSTRNMAFSVACEQGVDVENICQAGTWRNPKTFSGFTAWTRLGAKILSSIIQSSFQQLQMSARGLTCFSLLLHFPLLGFPGPRSVPSCEACLPHEVRDAPPRRLHRERFNSKFLNRITLRLAVASCAYAFGISDIHCTPR